MTAATKALERERAKKNKRIKSWKKRNKKTCEERWETKVEKSKGKIMLQKDTV